MLLAHQNFRAGADDLEVPHVVVVHVRAGVERTQRAVQAERRLGVTLLQPLPDHDLHAVPSGDVLLGLEHGALEIRLGELTLHRVTRPALHLRCGDAVAQFVRQLGQATLGAEVRFRRLRVGPNDEVEAAREVVNHRQFFGLQELDVRRADAARLHHARELFLDEAHGFVAKVARQPATKTRQPRRQQRLEARLVGGDEVQRVAFVSLHHLAIGDDFGSHARGAHQRARRQADERIAPEALAADHGFEQEGVLLPARQLQIERERGFQIGKRLGDERDAVVALLGQALEFKFGDHGAILSQTRSGCAQARRSATEDAGPPTGQTIRGESKEKTDARRWRRQTDATSRSGLKSATSDARARLPGRVSTPSVCER